MGLELAAGSGVGSAARCVKAWRDNKKFRDEVVDSAIESLGMDSEQDEALRYLVADARVVNLVGNPTEKDAEALAGLNGGALGSIDAKRLEEAFRDAARLVVAGNADPAIRYLLDDVASLSRTVRKLAGIQDDPSPEQKVELVDVYLALLGESSSSGVGYRWWLYWGVGRVFTSTSQSYRLHET